MYGGAAVAQDHVDPVRLAGVRARRPQTTSGNGTRRPMITVLTTARTCGRPRPPRDMRRESTSVQDSACGLEDPSTGLRPNGYADMPDPALVVARSANCWRVRMADTLPGSERRGFLSPCK
jgi:hypothetical protein